MSERHLRRRVAVRAAALTVFSASLVAATGSAAIPAPASEPSGIQSCPAAFPVSGLRPGMSAYGLTTDHGVTPHRFSVRILGVLKDGIAPGVDMILIRANSPAIRAAGGIWAGMSGSPVYAGDGRLIGAVSYGLSYGPSPTAGLTPARAMYDVLDFRNSAGAYVTHATLTPAAAASGLVPLPTPVAVSGASPRQMRGLAESADPDMRLFRSGTASAAPATGSSLAPGAPFAVAVSYGRFTYAGIGTTTAICGRRVLAWGHPMMAFGATTESAHVARILYVQKETLGASFVVGNVGGVIGTVTQDRLAAISARLGSEPPSARIHVDVLADNGLRRTGTTFAPVTSWVPSAAANAAYGELWSALQMDGIGSAWLTWTVTGHRAHGKTWTLSRTDRTDSQYGIGYSVGDLLYYPLSTIVGNPFENVTIDKLAVHVRASQQLREYTLRGLKVLSGSSYVDVTPALVLDVQPGQVLSLRATLAPYRGAGGTRQVELALVVPPGALPDTSGQVTVMGGADAGSSGGGQGASAAPGTPTSLDDVLRQLRGTPRNDVLYAQLDLPDAQGNSVTTYRDSANLGEVVRGTVTLQVHVQGQQPPPAGTSAGGRA